jgi:hypothetical protein
MGVLVLLLIPFVFMVAKPQKMLATAFIAKP